MRGENESQRQLGEAVIVAVYVDDIIIATEWEEKMNHDDSWRGCESGIAHVDDTIIATEWDEKMNHNDSWRDCDSGSAHGWYNNCYRMRGENESRATAGETVIVAVYVDDIIIATEWEEKMNHNDSRVRLW